MLSAKTRSLYFVAVALTLLLLLLGLFSTSREQDYFSGISFSSAAQCQLQNDLRKNIAIASSFGYHHDVYMAVAWTIERVFHKRAAHGHLQVYANTPFNRFGFQEVIEKLGLPEELVKDLLSGIENYQYDLIILGTLRQPANSELLAAWDALDEDRKFKLVCIVHNLADDAWQNAITEWSRRDAIRLLPLSEHVAVGFRHKFDVLSDSPDLNIQSAGYEYIPIDVHVPILDLPDLPVHASTRLLSNVVIQGTFSMDRRNYRQIFKDLNDSLSHDPAAWGYKPREPGQVSYEVDKSLPATPFHLYLLGSGSLEVPEELKNVISIHVDLSYFEFYSLMNKMDVCLPAFADNGYYDMQASSTFAMSLECNVPIMVTERTKKSYRYADDVRVSITRPAAMGDVAAILALRSGSTANFLNAHNTRYSPMLDDAVHDMMRKGWVRDQAGFEAFKRDVLRTNEDVIERILHDL
ncbi:hypothetical protein BDZ89DRAFT_1064277 [Hymenopellis radicata]|nr:hypothetical protein BDZ89DRAFT_1064277 [Hymenopellis radicata]